MFCPPLVSLVSPCPSQSSPLSSLAFLSSLCSPCASYPGPWWYQASCHLLPISCIFHFSCEYVHFLFPERQKRHEHLLCSGVKMLWSRAQHTHSEHVLSDKQNLVVRSHWDFENSCYYSKPEPVLTNKGCMCLCEFFEKLAQSPNFFFFWGLKQHTFIISQLPWIGNPGVASPCPLLRVCHRLQSGCGLVEASGGEGAASTLTPRTDGRVVVLKASVSYWWLARGPFRPLPHQAVVFTDSQTSRPPSPFLTFSIPFWFHPMVDYFP